MYGIVTLYDPAFQPNYPQCIAGSVPLDYNSLGETRQNDFQVELLPLHSQLLGESLLVSFPPLINMLKSSGSSYLISGPMLKREGGGGPAPTGGGRGRSATASRQMCRRRSRDASRGRKQSLRRVKHGTAHAWGMLARPTGGPHSPHQATAHLTATSFL